MQLVFFLRSFCVRFVSHYSRVCVASPPGLGRDSYLQGKNLGLRGKSGQNKEFFVLKKFQQELLRKNGGKKTQNNAKKNQKKP